MPVSDNVARAALLRSLKRAASTMTTSSASTGIPRTSVATLLQPYLSTLHAEAVLCALCDCDDLTDYDAELDDVFGDDAVCVRSYYAVHALCVALQQRAATTPHDAAAFDGALMSAEAMLRGIGERARVTALQAIAHLLFLRRRDVLTLPTMTLVCESVCATSVVDLCSFRHRAIGGRASNRCSRYHLMLVRRGGGDVCVSDLDVQVHCSMSLMSVQLEVSSRCCHVSVLQQHVICARTSTSCCVVWNFVLWYALCVRHHWWCQRTRATRAIAITSITTTLKSMPTTTIVRVRRRQARVRSCCARRRAR
jgi:hypothetical protein